MVKLSQKEMAEKSKERPANYEKLSAREQWQIDKELGILDWDGKEGGSDGRTR